MTVELLQTLSIIAFIVAGVLFLLGIALFFILDVPKLYGEISGRTAKKAIESIRQSNQSDGQTTSSSSGLRKSTTKITKTDALGTAKLNTKSLNEAAALSMAQSAGMAQGSTPSQVNETTVLGVAQPAGNETTLLGMSQPAGNETTLLSMSQPAGNETTLLGVAQPSASEPSYNETTLLQVAPGVNAVMPSVAATQEPDNGTLETVPVELLVEMTFMGSSEIIE